MDSTCKCCSEIDEVRANKRLDICNRMTKMSVKEIQDSLKKATDQVELYNTHYGGQIPSMFKERIDNEEDCAFAAAYELRRREEIKHTRTKVLRQDFEEGKAEICSLQEMILDPDMQSDKSIMEADLQSLLHWSMLIFTELNSRMAPGFYYDEEGERLMPCNTRSLSQLDAELEEYHAQAPVMTP